MTERIIVMNGFERRSAKKREQILQTALEIMNHPNGINNLTVQKIVKPLPFLKPPFLSILKPRKTSSKKLFSTI